MTDLTTIENRLIVPNNETVAVVQPAVASVIYKARVLEKPDMFKLLLFGEYKHGKDDICRGCYISDERVKVGQTFLGITGTIGEVELEADNNSAELVALVHIPQKVLPFVEMFKEGGMEEFYREFFGQTNGTDWQGGIWNLRECKSTIDSSKVDLPFVSKAGYFWKLEKVGSDIFEDGRPLEEQVAEYEVAVKEFIQKLDIYVMSLNPTGPTEITPAYAKDFFDKLALGQQKLLGRG